MVVNPLLALLTLKHKERGTLSAFDILCLCSACLVCDDWSVLLSRVSGAEELPIRLQLTACCVSMRDRTRLTLWVQDRGNAGPFDR
jgi:hypothetical protein